MSKRLLSLNVHYSPRSFGGATIVAEEVNKILATELDWTVCVVTTEHNRNLLPYQTSRYRSKGVTVISINLPHGLSHIELLHHAAVGRIMEDIIDIFKPDIVHMHAIQSMGIDFIQKLAHDNIRMVATLHDCWWICERQFMINRHGKYCFQEVIDKKVCMHCVDDEGFFEKRWNILRNSLSVIDKYLFPSKFHQGIHIINGLDADKCMVNKNGIRFPDRTIDRTSSRNVRFGFIGGPGYIKGGELIKNVFADLDEPFELYLVNAAQNVGQSWENDFGPVLKNKKVFLVDAYDQDGMDDFFESIDVLLFPSQWKESFGLTVREALVRDVWVISTASGGTIEDIKDGVNGNIIPLTSNEDYLEEAVLACIKRKDWHSYSNPLKDEIRSYRDQALELDQCFIELIGVGEELVTE
jgi:glycosyltransferase involved in cell wall biosynthesis